MRLLSYLLPKLASAAVTLLGVAILVFLALRFLPGGYAEVLLGPFVTEEARAMIAARYGLAQPVALQFLHWLGALLQGDLGVSMVTREPVAAEFLRRAPATLQLAAMALGAALVVGVPLGIRSALRAGRRGGMDGARLFGALGTSVPDFVLGSLLILLFSSYPLWLRIGGYAPLMSDPLANLRAMVLPALTLALFGAALILRTTRDAVLRVLTEGHITAAVARGETPAEILRHHVLRNAAIPVLTVVVPYFGFLLGGAVAMEVMFSIPGVGLYVFNGVQNRDHAIVQAGVLIAAVVFIAFSMLCDLLYALIDPRLTGMRR